MRRLAVIAAGVAALLVLAAVAFAAPNTVEYTPSLKYSGRAGSTPVNTSYTGVLDVGTTDGSQPNTASPTTLYFPRQIVNNAAHFPSCSKSAVDGKPSVPRSCRAAQIGSGNATALAGTPGQQGSVREDLTVKAYNGPRGKSILLVLTSKPGAPVAVTNRVIEGKRGRGTGAYRGGFTVRFVVPADLQRQLGLQVSLTHFDVTISTRKKERVRVGRRSRLVSYLQVRDCPRSKNLPYRTVVAFNKDDGTPGLGEESAEGTFRCK